MHAFVHTLGMQDGTAITKSRSPSPLGQDAPLASSSTNSLNTSTNSLNTAASHPYQMSLHNGTQIGAQINAPTIHSYPPVERVREERVREEQSRTIWGHDSYLNYPVSTAHPYPKSEFVKSEFVNDSYLNYPVSTTAHPYPNLLSHELALHELAPPAVSTTAHPYPNPLSLPPRVSMEAITSFSSVTSSAQHLQHLQHVPSYGSSVVGPAPSAVCESVQSVTSSYAAGGGEEALELLEMYRHALATGFLNAYMYAYMYVCIRPKP